MLNPEYLADLLTNPVCQCGDDCSRFWSRELWQQMHEPILDFVRNRLTYMKWMYTYIFTSSWKPETQTFSFAIGGRNVCSTAFRAFWHLTRHSFGLIIGCIKQGLDLPVHGNLGQDRNATKEQMCSVFLSKLENVSEHQPDTEEVHLVERLNKIDVYEAMVAGIFFTKFILTFTELSAFHTPEEMPTLKTFYKVWRRDHSHLKSPKACRLGRCDVCSDFAEKIRASKGIVFE